MKLSTQVFNSLVVVIAIIGQPALATYVDLVSQSAINNESIAIRGAKNSYNNYNQQMSMALSKTKTIVMELGRIYHCHEKGSDIIQKGRSSFRCELMKQDNINNPYDYTTTNKIVNLSCSGELSGSIEYDEGTVYKFLMVCKKPIGKNTSTNTNTQPKHKIGLVQAKEAQSGGYGPVAYWLAGNKKEKELVFFEDREIGLINIDGQDISLKRISRKYQTPESKGLIKLADYNSQTYRVKIRSFKDVTTAKDKAGCARRVRGILEVSSTDGWNKRINIESAGDICG